MKKLFAVIMVAIMASTAVVATAPLAQAKGKKHHHAKKAKKEKKKPEAGGM